MKLEYVDESWELKPLPLIFDESDINIIVIGSKDVEEENKVVVSKEIGSYTFARSGNDLMITNAFDGNLMNDKLCTISLSGFYQEAKMKTLTIKFADQEIVLKDHQEQVNTARDIDAIKKEQRDRICNEVFNNTMNENISPEVMSSNETIIDEIGENRQSSRTRRAIDENEKYAASKPSNSIFNWVKELIGGLCGKFLQDNIDYVNANLKQARERQMPVKFKSKGENTILEMGDHYLSQVDSNGTIMLLDLFIRKVTDQKYISTVDRHISLPEAQGYALNIIKRFERVLNKTAVKSGISVKNLNFNPVAVQSTIVGKMGNGRFSEVSKILYESAKEACPEFKQTGKFLMQLKSHLEDILAEKEAVLLLNQQKAEHS